MGLSTNLINIFIFTMISSNLQADYMQCPVLKIWRYGSWAFQNVLSYPAPWMTTHFPLICFTNLAAAWIASGLTVSSFFLFVTAQPPSLMITSTSHLSAIKQEQNQDIPGVLSAISSSPRSLEVACKIPKRHQNLPLQKWMPYCADCFLKGSQFENC